MQTILIVMGSLVASSLLWIIPLLLMDRNKPEEEATEQPTAEETSEKECEEKVFADDQLEEVDVTSFYAYTVVDELINVAFANKIVSEKVSVEFAFSIN